MDVAQLKTLIHVAELGSLSKAADRLRIAQPALSRQIRLLEKELGAVLFERHGRGMVITEIGREVLNHATRVMTELDAIRNVTSEESASFKGLVSIGTTPTVAEIVTVPLVKKIKEVHPQSRSGCHRPSRAICSTGCSAANSNSPCPTIRSRCVHCASCR